MVKLRVEIANNSLTLAQGLMGVKNLDEDQGMLFVFPNLVDGSFWGKNTYIPLDLAFIKDDQITEIKGIVPHSTRAVRSSKPCEKAIEANAGYFKKHNIKPGDKIELKQENDENVIVFKR